MTTHDRQNEQDTAKTASHTTLIAGSTSSYFTILRDAMTIDDLKSPSLYFGTTTGQLWIGRENGGHSDCLFDFLPPNNCEKIAVV